jgi:small subunit ribosomal protein S1
MTDQERPVEERNEMPEDLRTAATTAVEELEASGQASAAADEQPESAEQPAVPAAETVPPPATNEGASAPVAETADDGSAAYESPPPDESQSAVAAAAEQLPAEAESVPESAAVAQAPAAQAEQPSAAAEQLPAEAESVPESAAVAQAPAAQAEQPSAAAEQLPAEAESVPESAAVAQAPAAQAEQPSAAAEGAPEAEAEGASYTPVTEEESGRPRRVKDLEPGMELEGHVTSIALYGIFVDIGVGRDGLVHISEMSDTRIDSPSDLVQIGDTVKVRVKSVEPDGRRISLTMRSKDRGAEPRGRTRKKAELNREALAALRVGDNIEGTVTGIAPFGVFVDIGVGKDGLVHVSELAEGRIDKPEDAVQVGQTYTFKVLEVDAEGTRISLSLRRAQRNQRMQQIEKGQILEGKVSGLASFGAFIDIGVGRDGLVHISEVSEGRVEKVEDVLKVGDTVKVRVLEVDPQSKRISLSMRLEDRPREAPAPYAEASAEPREERGRRDDRGRREERGPRGARQEAAHAEAAPAPDQSAEEESEDEFRGDATLEDLLSKFSGGKRDRRRRQAEDDEDEEDRLSRRQREAHRRTLQQLSEDE